MVCDFLFNQGLTNIITSMESQSHPNAILEKPSEDSIKHDNIKEQNFY